MSAKPWFGRVIYSNEGIVEELECDTQAEAMAFVAGFKAAQTITKEDDEDGLKEYTTSMSQEKSKDE